jgi:large subunit ribosomal protein L10
MPRPEKVQAVAEIKERIEGAQAVFLAEYAGLSVNEQQELRRALRANGAEFKVMKMTLARLAADDLEINSLDELLLGPTGLAFADGDPVGAAKVLKDFSKEHDVFVVKGGLLGMDFLTPERISELADIEPREVLLAKLAGAMQAPMANLAGLLAALSRNTASALQQLLEKKEAAAAVDAVEEVVAVEAVVEESAAEVVNEEVAAVEDAAEEANEEASAEEAAEEEATASNDSDIEVPAAGSAEEAEGVEEPAKTEDDSEATVEASDDADDDTEDDNDEASNDDAEEK